MNSHPISVADLPTEFPNDAIPAIEVANRLGRSRRTVARWISASPEELTRYLFDQGAGQTRLYLSWSEVVSYCLKRDLLPAESLNFSPDAKLSDAISARDVAPDIPHDKGVDDTPVVSPPPDIVAPVAEDGDTHDTRGRSHRVQGVMSGGEDTLRAEVARLSTLLSATEGARRREVEQLEARITELKSVIARLTEAHQREVRVLTEELVARRGEASEARAAAEAQRQREAALRWQTAVMKGERDLALTELMSWSGAGWFRRMLGRPRIPKASEPESTENPILLELQHKD